jgi:acyl-CoA thioester hydrolase
MEGQVSDDLVTWRGACRTEWLDYNGHMSEAYYVLVFGYATDGIMAAVGIDDAYRAANAASLYTVESHIHYLDEVAGGTPLTITTQLLEADTKRLRYFQRLWAAGQEHPVATTEILGLHVVGKPPRSAVFPTDIQAKVDALRAEHGAIPWPPVAGLGIALKRRRGP